MCRAKKATADAAMKRTMKARRRSEGNTHGERVSTNCGCSGVANCEFCHNVFVFDVIISFMFGCVYVLSV